MIEQNNIPKQNEHESIFDSALKDAKATGRWMGVLFYVENDGVMKTRRVTVNFPRDKFLNSEKALVDLNAKDVESPVKELEPLPVAVPPGLHGPAGLPLTPFPSMLDRDMLDELNTPAVLEIPNTGDGQNDEKTD